MLLTIKHYYNFGRALNDKNVLITPEGWDAVRCDDDDTPFAIPKDEKTFALKASNKYSEETQDIIGVIDEKKFNSIFSVGCGCGFLEYNLKKKEPRLHIIATDYNLNSVNRLRNVFTECDEIQKFDMKSDIFYEENHLLYLMFRIDTEINDVEWNQVFKRMHDGKVANILIVATEFLTFERFAKETIKGLLKNVKGYTFCGYIRTKAKFESSRPRLVFSSDIVT